MDRATLATMLTQRHRDAGLTLEENGTLWALKDGERVITQFLDVASLRVVRDLADNYLRETPISMRPKPIGLRGLQGSRPS